MSLYTSTCIHTGLHACMNTVTYVYISIYVNMNVCMYVCICTYTYGHMYMCNCIHYDLWYAHRLQTNDAVTPLRLSQVPYSYMHRLGVGSLTCSDTSLLRLPLPEAYSSTQHGFRYRKVRVQYEPERVPFRKPPQSYS